MGGEGEDAYPIAMQLEPLPAYLAPSRSRPTQDGSGIDTNDDLEILKAIGLGTLLILCAAVGGCDDDDE
jgi:hypothetical protein